MVPTIHDHLRMTGLLLLLVPLALASCPDSHSQGDFRSGFSNSYTEGSENKFCGSCDFEKNTCGWNDTSNGEFRWRLEMANISSIPGIDHTTGSPWGHVMHVDGEEPGIFSKAVLGHTFSQPSALGCKISFWYHLHDPIGISSHFYLNVVTEGSSVTLWQIKQGQTDNWVNASVKVGNRPKGFKLEFYVDPTYIGSQDIMLDDVKLTDCSEGDVPADSDQLSCDFEENTCAWYHDMSANLIWTRGNGQKPTFDNQGPGHDHTTGSGYYMFIAAKSNSNSSHTARLISFPQQAKCVSFWYYIYGGSIGSLKFISKNADRTETVVWMRANTQGNKWHFAELSFSASDSPVQFIFEGVLGGTDGSIALDDVKVQSSVSGSCPSERVECTFQSSLCGLQPDSVTDFHWIRTTGEQAAGFPSPSTDHTLGTDQGYYLSAQLWQHPNGSQGSMVTQVNEPTPESGECWMFWYYMAGRDVGVLNMYLKGSGSDMSHVPLWTRSLEQGERWRHGRATVHSPHSPYQIIFEAVVGEGQVKDIAIDDLSVLNEPCLPDGLCDFEMDLCGWVNSILSANSMTWSWTSGTSISSSSYAPSVDHTTNSALGHYMAFDSSYTSATQTAHLQSELMPPVESACLEFWYFMDMMQYADKLTLNVYLNESGSLHVLWSIIGAQGRVWHNVTLDYSASEPYQIVFEAIRRPFDTGAIALDDINIKEGLSCSNVIPTTPPPTMQPTTPPPSSMDCSFEEGLCDWIQETGDGFDWIHQRGQQVDIATKGPMYDHTLGNNHGFCLLLNISGGKDSETAVISAPMTMQVNSVCIEFWYYTLGTSVAHLDLLTETKMTETTVWSTRGTKASEWIKTQITVSGMDTQRIKFSGSRNSKSSGFIAIDDVRVTPGVCVDQNPCGFEGASLCGFQQGVGDTSHWQHINGSTGHIDHTYGTQMGHSMAVFGKDLLKPVTMQLLTPEYSETTESCLQFWYWMSTGSSDSLAVHVYLNGELGPALWSLTKVPSTGWEVAEVTLSSPSKFMVVFRAKLTPSKDSFILLDDVSVRGGACFPTGSCDFESGYCTWVNGAERYSGSNDWVHADGYAHGPPVDQTTYTTDGKFMLSPSQIKSADHSSKAVLFSERILHSSDSCFSFWYHLSDSDPGTLRVFLDEAEVDKEMVFQTDITGLGWRNFSITVSKINPYQIVLEAESKNAGFIAVDDITLTKGPCEDVAVVGGNFVGCQFEVNSCEWEDVSVGQFAWQRDCNGTETENTGPSVDHTTGTEQGWYMAVEASQGDQNSYAAFQSPAMKQASTECVLEFYYHMYGEGIGELKVFLQEGVRRTPLWWKSGDHGDTWHRGELGVGRTHQVFTILFEATRTFSELGDIAIDDISFLNCSLPEPQESCPAGMFKCTNLVCVKQSKVCDFSDDCGDGSDEAQCDALGYKQRCSFEQGMCSWENSDKWAGWALQSGERAWPERGPPRDHTRNTAASHYIIPVHQQSENQIAEIISSTLLPSSDCTVSFYHYSNRNSSMATLTMRLKSSTGDDNDDIILWRHSMTNEYHWRRAEVSFSSLVKTKIAFRFMGTGEGLEEYIAVDDVSFSLNCVHDPDNSQLPITPPTIPPYISTALPSSPTPTDHPCGEAEFHCWMSEGVKCIAASAQCDYSLDCSMGEDEETCGPCTFELGLCQWSDISEGNNKWQRLRASDSTKPPTDHTSGKGYFMHVNFSSESFGNEALFQSPLLPPNSPYCQMLFNFNLDKADCMGNLSVLLVNEEGKKTHLWTCSHNTASDWNLEYLPIGKQHESYRVVFSSNASLQRGPEPAHCAVAVDDISFLHCETLYQPPALSSAGCSFEEDMCGWVQGGAKNLQWLRNRGATETVNTGPAWDHTSRTGYYLYIESSSPNRKGHAAQLKSPLLPPAGESGYCLKLWYHMFGATVGSLQMFLQTMDSRETVLVWQRTGSQGNEWRVVQSHVTLQEVHQILIEASVGGEAGDIAIDDLSFTEGACVPAEGFCGFEEGSCNWIQQTDDDFNWVRGSGKDPALNSKLSFDHTTNTDNGHYFYMNFYSSRAPGYNAVMKSPVFAAGNGQCLHLWYYMSGQDCGSLNVYQETLGGVQSLIISHSEEQGKMWRFAQAPLPYTQSDYRIMVEGIKGQSDQAVMAVDDVLVSHYPCTGPGQCDFEMNMCSWSNLMEEDDTDWLRDQGSTQASTTGPSVDHTTNSSKGYYLYVDSSVGMRGDRALLLSEIFPPDASGQCFTFWYHMLGHNVGTLNLYTNNRTMQSSVDRLGHRIWTESGDQGDMWWRAKVYINHKEPFWFVFEYQKGEGSSGDVAIDDTHISPGQCDPEPPTTAAPIDAVGIGVGVAVTILAVVIACMALYVLQKRRPNSGSIIENNILDGDSVLGFDYCELQESES